MIYLVLEVYPSIAIIVDEEGRFFKAANLGYEVGEKIVDPVIMRPVKKSNPLQLRKPVIGALIGSAAAILVFFGLRLFTQSGFDTVVHATIYMTINPAVRMDINAEDQVIELTGTNQDGRALIRNYDARRKDKLEVTEDLLNRAQSFGFLSEDGEVVILLDTEDDEAFQKYGLEFRGALNHYVVEHPDLSIRIERWEDTATDESSTTEKQTIPPAETTKTKEMTDVTRPTSSVATSPAPVVTTPVVTTTATIVSTTTASPTTTTVAPTTSTTAVPVPVPTEDNDDWDDDDWDDDDDDDQEDDD